MGLGPRQERADGLARAQAKYRYGHGACHVICQSLPAGRGHGRCEWPDDKRKRRRRIPDWRTSPVDRGPAFAQAQGPGQRTNCSSARAMRRRRFGPGALQRRPMARSGGWFDVGAMYVLRLWPAGRCRFAAMPGVQADRAKGAESQIQTERDFVCVQY